MPVFIHISSTLARVPCLSAKLLSFPRPSPHVKVAQQCEGYQHSYGATLSDLGFRVKGLVHNGQLCPCKSQMRGCKRSELCSTLPPTQGLVLGSVACKAVCGAQM